jgi:hypothetical protein
MRRFTATAWPRSCDDLLKRMSPAEIEKGEQAAKDVAASIKPARRRSSE